MGTAFLSTIEGEENTSSSPSLEFTSRLVIPIVRVNYLFVSPWIILGIPPAALFQQSALFTILIAAIGLTGMLRGRRRLASVASLSLLSLLVWEKAAGDLFGLGAPDTAVLMFQFMGVLFFMEASGVVLTFDWTNKVLSSKRDDISMAVRGRVLEWTLGQLVELGKLTLAAVGLSLGLLVLGSVLNVSLNQLAFTAILVLGSAVAVLFLLTNRREPAGPVQLN
jgi:hypothetical protein